MSFEYTVGNGYGGIMKYVCTVQCALYLRVYYVNRCLKNNEKS